MTAELTMERPRGFEFARRAWRSLISAIREMPLLFVSSIVALAILQLGILRFDPLRPAAAALMRYHRSIASLALQAARGGIVIFIRALIIAPVAVAIHRQILLKETTPGLISLRPAHTRQFVIWTVILQLIGSMLMRISVSPMQVATISAARVSGYLFLAVGVVTLFIGIRFMLIFPAVAIGTPAPNSWERLRTSWNQTSGNFWLIFRAGFLAVAPLYLLFIIQGIVLALSVRSKIAAGVVGHQQPLNASSLISWQQGVVSSILTLLIAASAAALASWLYKWVTNPTEFRRTSHVSPGQSQ